MSVPCGDHLHLYVADTHRATAWYADVRGPTPHAGLAARANDPMGPWILAAGDDDGPVAYRPPLRTAAARHDIRISDGGRGYRAFRRAPAAPSIDGSDWHDPSSSDIVDHGGSVSLYFRDVDANPLEVTCYGVTGLSA